MGEVSAEYLLKCSNCNKPVSVDPVYHHNGVESVCGRCINILENNGGWERQTVYENIAYHLLFPCAFEIFGCPVKLQWNNVDSHERSCTFQKISCPLSHNFFMNKCFWIDKYENLSNHIRKKHKNMITTLPSLKVSQIFENSILFWEITGHLVIIMLVFNEESNKYLLYISGDFENKSYLCQVTTGDSMTSPYIIGHIKMVPFDGKYLDTQENTLELNMDYIKKMFATDNLTLKFNIMLSQSLDTVPTDLNEKILQQLECPICVEYMKPPINVCEAGHSICSQCYNKVNQCPLCRKNLLGGRNYALETLTSKVSYPCQNKWFGCNFAAILQDVLDHQSYCQYKGKKCFMENCLWKGPQNDFKMHLEKLHPNDVLKLDEVKNHNFNNDKGQYILLHNDNIFILILRSNARKFIHYAVLHYGCDTTSYKYDFTLMSCSSFSMNVTLSKYCQAVPSHVDITKYSEYSVISIPFKFFDQFMLNTQQIKLKLNIE